jgi:hypothetical protein
MGSNPGTIYWMDVSDDDYIIRKLKIKVAKWDTPKKEEHGKSNSLTVKYLQGNEEQAGKEIWSSAGVANIFYKRANIWTKIVQRAKVLNKQRLVGQI